ncbi:MAG: hypothetical protein PHG47_09710 [Sulfuricella sp.]|nr:hypothetical protein [Sulfuricella sp.]
MIPAFDSLGSSPWLVLPPGIHAASLAEVEIAFSTTPHRKELFAGLVAAAKNLADAGCQSLYLDGSYVTGKPRPGDFDACWEPAGVDPALLDPVFLDFSNKRQNQKNKYKGEFFPFGASAAPGVSFIDFFQTDRFTGLRKGIVLIDLRCEPFVVSKGVQP